MIVILRKFLDVWRSSMVKPLWFNKARDWAIDCFHPSKMTFRGQERPVICNECTSDLLYHINLRIQSCTMQSRYSYYMNQDCVIPGYEEEWKRLKNFYWNYSALFPYFYLTGFFVRKKQCYLCKQYNYQDVLRAVNSSHQQVLITLLNKLQFLYVW